MSFGAGVGRMRLVTFILFTTLVSMALGSFNFVTPQGVISIGSSLAAFRAGNTPKTSPIPTDTPTSSGST